jgi:hypothetical protein
MPKFRKKPVIIDAVLFDGENWQEILKFVGSSAWSTSSPDYHGAFDPGIVYIDTLEGRMEISKGDWVIKGVQGEFYPCKPDIFEATYDLVEETILDRAVHDLQERKVDGY